MTLFLFADLHDSSQQERGLLAAFQQSLIDDPYHYLITDGKGDRDVQAMQLTEREARSVVQRFLAADYARAGTANQQVSAPHFAVLTDELSPQAMLWEYISASPFSTHLRSFNSTNFEVNCFADALFRTASNIQSLLVPLPIVKRDDLGMDISYREHGNHVILSRS